MKRAVSIATSLLFSQVVDFVEAADDEKSCNLWQTCLSNDGLVPDADGNPPAGDDFGVCANPSDVSLPVFIEGGFYPAKVKTMSQSGIDALATACPFYTTKEALCCNTDNAQIMQQSYTLLDGVFFSDCPICAVNLKRMWCEYACGTDKATYLLDQGTREVDGVTYQNVQVTIDEDYACVLFQSCKKESFISLSGVQSAVQFLDFLGYNGAMYSLSYINFTYDSPDTTGHLNVEAYPCDYDVPSDGELLGYKENYNTTCSYCQARCSPPVVDDKIGFLDGFSWKLFGFCYLGFIVFSVLYQLLQKGYYQKKRVARIQELNAMQNGKGQGGQSNAFVDDVKSNNSGISQPMGRPLNMTTSERTEIHNSQSALSQ